MWRSLIAGYLALAQTREEHEDMKTKQFLAEAVAHGEFAGVVSQLPNEYEWLLAASGGLSERHS